MEKIISSRIKFIYVEEYYILLLNTVNTTKYRGVILLVVFFITNFFLNEKLGDTSQAFWDRLFKAQLHVA